MLWTERTDFARILSEDNGRYRHKNQDWQRNGLELIQDCSLVTAKYSVGDIIIGSIGVIGPTRMNTPG